MRQLFLLLIALPTLALRTQPCNDVQACILASNNTNGSYLFENCSTPIANSQFIWSFGDGTSARRVEDHFYTQPGTYTVCLTMYWQNCVDSTCTTIVVGNTDPCDVLHAGFSANTTPNGTVFSNTTTGVGSGSTWQWTFGDGAVSDNPQPVHTYAEPGIYYTCLTVISLYEHEGQVITCVDSICNDVIIVQPGACDEVEACILASNNTTVDCSRLLNTVAIQVHLELW